MSFFAEQVSVSNLDHSHSDKKTPSTFALLFHDSHLSYDSGTSLPKFHPEMCPSHVYVQLSQGLTLQKWKTRSGLLKHELSVFVDNQTVVFTLTFFDARYVRFLAGDNFVAENLSIRMDTSWMTFLSNSSRLVLAGD